jgi:hypothetical protein
MPAGKMLVCEPYGPLEINGLQRAVVFLRQAGDVKSIIGGPSSPQVLNRGPAPPAGNQPAEIDCSTLQA